MFVFDCTAGWEPRCWKLEGSVNGKDWTVVKEHKNDERLSGAFSCASVSKLYYVIVIVISSIFDPVIIIIRMILVS